MSQTGKLEAIWLKRMKGGPMDTHETAVVQANKGIVGNANQGGKRQVTIIEKEVWELLMAQMGGDLDPSTRRANLMISGEIDLANTIGQVLQVGECRIRIYGETKPCEVMDKALRGMKDGDEVKAMMAKLGIDMAVYDDVMKKKGKVSGKDLFKKVAYHIREDGAYVEAGENDNLIVQKLEKDTGALGVFGFSFLDQNADKVKGAVIDGSEPTFENIADGSYPVSRPLFVYVKNAHVGKIPGMKEYIQEFTSEKAWGDEGYLSEKGMIPMPEEERKAFAEDAATLKNLAL